MLSVAAEIPSAPFRRIVHASFRKLAHAAPVAGERRREKRKEGDFTRYVPGRWLHNAGTII
jgi:hypothetical protein